MVSGVSRGWLSAVMLHEATVPLTLLSLLLPKGSALRPQKLSVEMFGAGLSGGDEPGGDDDNDWGPGQASPRGGRGGWFSMRGRGRGRGRGASCHGLGCYALTGLPLCTSMQS